MKPPRYNDPVCSFCLADNFPSQNNQLLDPNNVGDDMKVCVFCEMVTTDGLLVWHDRSELDGAPPVFDEVKYYMSRHL